MIDVDLESAYGVKRGKKNRHTFPNPNIELMPQKPSSKPESSCNC